MKRLAFAVLAAFAAFCSGCAAQRNLGYIAYDLIQNPPWVTVNDGVSRFAADNVRFAVFRCENSWYACCTEQRSTKGWESFCPTDDNEIELASGEFGFVTADVTFRSGGIEGWCNSPGIDRLISFNKADISEIETYCAIPELGEGSPGGLRLYHSAAGTYCIFMYLGFKTVEADGKKERKFFSEYRVFLDGEAVGAYDMDKYEADDLIALLEGNGGKK